MKKLVNLMLRLNLWIIFLLSVFGAVGLSVLLAIVLNSIFYNGSNNLIMLGAVIIPFVDAPIFVILLIAMIKELRDSRQMLDRRVKERTVELKKANDALKQEIKDRENLQAQLIQAQKMESIGRLAGGVAHDFNNILSVIIGYSDMAIKKVSAKDPLYEDLQEIFTAAKRSRDITRQLLAFARKETISPEVLDLNSCVESMLKILRRLIGEDITLTWLAGTRLLPVLMDRCQLEQILANLCINARDAIHDVGKITIETDIKIIDENYCTNNVGFVPGEYMVILVRDNGHGMDRETLNNIFEPFFTTKGIGKGTGLGLSTVHGIVNQNNGFIKVYSEPGKGSTFKIFLPKYDGEIAMNSLQPEERSAKGRGEKLLVVEDDISILKLAERILVNQEYNVFVAQTPTEALQFAKTHADEIALLITDVVMPGMNGKELAERLKALNPQIKCLYMSGYTADIIVHRGVLDKGIHFIQKPFTSNDLSAKVRAVLDAQENQVSLSAT